MKIAIIGAGAAGCFCAVNLRRLCPEAQIDVYESSQRPLQKVAVTGGGRCNLTNTFAEVGNLQQVYPRGYQLMKRLFRRFGHEQTIQWWEREGVRLVAQEDQCIFPKSQNAMEIVETLLRGMRGVRILCSHRVTGITPLECGYHVTASNKITQKDSANDYDAVVVTTGGSPKATGLSFLAPLNLVMVEPVPSLFTFNIASAITQLMGLVVEPVAVSIAGTRLRTEGPLLVTHWGMSGPAILKLSSHAARWLAEHDYRATLCVNWMGDMHEEEVRQQLSDQLLQNPKKQIGSVRPATSSGELLTQRFWHYLLNNVSIPVERRCAEVGGKQLRRLAAALTSDTYPIVGQSRFKEEFVTCGGVALSGISSQTLESTQHPGLYFAGEVTDVDAVTGGFNLQAAWTMGRVVAESIAEREIGFGSR